MKCNEMKIVFLWSKFDTKSLFSLNLHRHVWSMGINNEKRKEASLQKNDLLKIIKAGRRYRTQDIASQDYLSHDSINWIFWQNCVMVMELERKASKTTIKVAWFHLNNKLSNIRCNIYICSVDHSIVNTHPKYVGI